MKFEGKQSIFLPERDIILHNLHSLKFMTTGQADRLFCNLFLNESVQLLINSIFLYEDGYFDCAFYSIRQAYEVGNSMLYIANNGKLKLNIWNEKGYYPMNKKLIEELSKIDVAYSEIRMVNFDFFKEYDELLKKAHKIIHKQGFDTFYDIREAYRFNKKFNKNEEIDFFLKLLKYSIGMAIILYIVVDPISLVLADDDLSARFNFDPLTEPANIQFFNDYLTDDIITKIKSTESFLEFSSYFANKEKMLPSVFDVVRNQAFDIDSLDKIKKQEHLLSLNERIILEILMAEVKLSKIYPDCSFMACYFTSIQSNYIQSSWFSSEYQRYLKYDESFNKPYHNIYRSITKGIVENWIFEHNEPLSDEVIKLIKLIFDNYRTVYDELWTQIELTHTITS